MKRKNYLGLIGLWGAWQVTYDLDDMSLYFALMLHGIHCTNLIQARPAFTL